MAEGKSRFGAELQEKAIAHDVDGIIALLRPKLQGRYGSLYFAGGQPVAGYDLDDVLSHLEEKVWRCIDQYDPDKSSFYTYVSRTVDHAFIDLIRKAGRPQNIAIVNAQNIAINGTFTSCDDPTWSKDDGVDSNDTTSIAANDPGLLQVEIDLFVNLGLTTQERTVITLRQKGLVPAKIAQVMGITQGRVSQLLSSARDKWFSADSDTPTKQKVKGGKACDNPKRTRCNQKRD